MQKYKSFFLTNEEILFIHWR